MSGGPGVSIQDAIARAKEIAARITSGKPPSSQPPSSAGGPSPSGSSSSVANAPWNKRSHSDEGGDTPPAKQMRGEAADKVALAASIAARLTSKLGGGPSVGQSAGPAPTPFPTGGQFSAAVARNESISIPDRHVGYLIGRGGETIQRIVRESGCKVQISQEQTGPERSAALCGTEQQLQHAKQMIRDVLEKAQETEQSKALAAELVQHGGRGGPGAFSDNGSHHGGGGSMGGSSGNLRADRDRPYGTSLDSCDDDSPEYIIEQRLVPTTRVALIIGRGGDTIRRLQDLHRVKMELAHKPTEVDEKGVASHVLKVRGLPQDVHGCCKVVQGVVDGSLHTNQIFRSMAGGDDGGGGGSGGGYYPEAQAQMGGGKPNDVQTRQFPVPVDKAGIVIGRGGESIKEICRISGAHCEVSKERDPNARSKPFNITGTPPQIEAAIRLISQKAGMTSSSTDGDYPGYPPSGGSGYPGYPPASGGPGYPPQPAWGGYPPAPAAPSWPPQAAAADPGSYNNYYAAWYGQQQQQQQQHWSGNPNQQPGMPPPPPANGSEHPPGHGHGHEGPSERPPGAGPDSSANGSEAPAPGMNQSAGQTDYTEAWVEYYRRCGMHDYANWAQQWAKQQQQGAGAPPQPGGASDKQSEPAPPPPPPGVTDHSGQSASSAGPGSAPAGAPGNPSDYAAYYAQYYGYGYPGYSAPQPPGGPGDKK